MTVLREVDVDPQPAARVGVGRGRLGLTLVFVGLGAVFSTFASRVPAVKAGLHLSSGTLGLALLGAAVGLAAGAPVAGWLLGRADPRAVIAAGLAVSVAGLEAVLAAGGAAALFAALVVFGLGGGLVDVAMNTEAAALQTRAGRPVMSGFHAGWSIGGLLGSGAGALAASARVSLGWHFGLAGAVAVVVGGVALATLGDAPAPGRDVVDEGSAGGASAAGRSWRVLLVAIGVMTAGDFLAEGAAGDWSAVYLHGSLGAPPGTAALGFGAFSLTMAAGRLLGDRLTARIGATRLLRGAAGLAGGGLAVGLLIGTTWSGLIGFALLGAGLSVVVPLLFSAAAGVGRASRSVATATFCGYLGLVCGPPAVGGLAEAIGLPAALGVVAVIAAVPVVLGRLVR